MNTERENNNSKTSLSANGGVPVVSLGANNPIDTGIITENYDILGNEFIAYYDNSHKLIFIMDNTIDSRKPNAMLVINPVLGRKWDDILSNDFSIDLETIRPKKDNKYQKLDIEYNGLSIYNKLINQFNNGTDTGDVILELSNFRNASALRAATERLDVARETITTSRETISKSAESLREIQAVLKKLREKLVRQKKEFGREPAKQSAAKILKTESQIDSANEKNKRAKKRLANAQRRLTVAIADADRANHIIGQTTKQNNPKAKSMADEVKPLFNKDPEIMDDKIAFKPIEFNALNNVADDNQITQSPILNNIPNFAPIDIPAPLAFTPPNADEKIITEMPSIRPPVLDTIKPMPIIDTPIPEPVAIITDNVSPAPMPIPRPVSPMSGMPVMAVPVASDNSRPRPNALYYIMLVVLIVLSIFTLWMYQKSTSDNIPEIVETTTALPAPTIPSPDIIESPFIQEQPVAVPEVITTPEVIVPEYIEESPMVQEYIEEAQLPAPEPIMDDTQYDEPVYNEMPPEIAPAPAPRVINKPAYGAGSSSEQMFVPDDNYQPDNRVNYSDPAPVNNYEEQAPEYYE